MRPATIMAWIFVGLGLLMIGELLPVFEITEGAKLAGFLAATGLAYFAIGMVLAIVSDRHMAKRTRASRE